MNKDRSYFYNTGLLFYEVSEKYSNKEAVVNENKEAVSFGELNRLSNQIGRYLISRGVKSGDVICLFNKSFFGFASMLACLKIGVAYANLDHISPPERLKKIIARCMPVFIINCFEQQTEIVDYDVPTFNVSDKQFINDVIKESAKNLEATSHIVGSAPAYIMFTSGSTGFPKGAVISHENLLNFIAWGRWQYGITPDDKITNLNPLYFDNSVFDFYLSLFNGAALLSFVPETVKEPAALVNRINELRPTIWFSVPSMLIFLLTTKAITENDFKSLRVITFGGEGFPKTKLKQLYDLFKSRVRFVNVYGPTECTCICSAYDIMSSDFDEMSGIPALGHLIPNFKYVIWNEEKKASDFAGELCLMGPQVGLGYINDPDLTANVFVQNPLNKNYREIVYKTGDLVKLGEDGFLYFTGRKDNQIKHMGYRIELEEIEAAFNAMPQVRESCVVYQKDKGDIGQIIAYVSAAGNEQSLLAQIKKIIPSYMAPRHIVIMDELPKNKNGKINRCLLTNKLL